MTERCGEHVPRRAPERGAILVCRIATRRVPPVVFELVERAAS